MALCGWYDKNMIRKMIGHSDFVSVINVHTISMAIYIYVHLFSYGAVGRMGSRGDGDSKRVSE